MKHRTGLRVRLLLLVLIAVTPLFGVSVFWAVGDERAELDRAVASLQTAASMEAARQSRLVESARQVLIAVAAAADIKSASAQQCQAYLESLREIIPLYNNLAVIQPDGTLRCGTRIRTPFVFDQEQVSHFREVLVKRGFVVGDYMVGAISGKPVLGFGYPATDSSGQVNGVLFASVRLQDMQQDLQALKLAPGQRIAVLDRNARVLASTNDRLPAGMLLPAGRLRADVLAGGAAGVAGAGRDPEDSASQMHAVVAMAGKDLFVVVSVERESVLGPGRVRLATELFLLACFAVLGACLAWLVAGRFIVQPARSILDATARLQSGELSTRLPFEGRSGSEFAQIAGGLNRMAEALEQRDQALQAALASAADARATQDLVLNTMSEGVIAVDTQREYLMFNRAASLVFAPGLPAQPGRDAPRLRGIFKPGTQTLFTVDELPLVRALRGESGADFDMFVRNEQVPDGRLIRGNFRPIIGPAGIMGALGVFTDITERSRLEDERQLAETELRETQRRLLEAQRIGQIGNWESDAVSRRFWWSDEVYELFGVAKGDFDETFAGFAKLVHPDDQAGLQMQRAAAIGQAGNLDSEFRIVTPGGDIRWMHARGEVRKGADGQPVALTGVVQDITARRAGEAARLAAEQQIQDNADRLARLVAVLIELAETDAPTEALLDGLALLAQRVTGAARAEFELLDGEEFVLRSSAGSPARPHGSRRARGLLSRQVDERAHALRCDDVERDPRVNAAWCRENQVGSLVGALVRANGSVMGCLVVLSSQTHAFGDADQRVLELLTEFVSALLQKKHAAVALSNSEQRYTALFEAGPVPMWVFDLQSLRFLAVNDAAVNAYGFTREEFMAMTLFDIRPDGERQNLLLRQAGGFVGQPSTLTHRRKDGSEFSVQSLARDVQYGGRAARFALAFDVTERVKAEKAVAEHLFTLQRAADAAEVIVSQRTLPDTLREVADQLRSVIGAHQAFVTVVTDGDWEHQQSVVSLSDRYAPYRDLMQNVDGSGIYALVCETNRPMRLSQPELQAHPRWKGFGGYAGKHPPMIGWLAVPLVGRDGKNMGVMQLSDKYEGEFTPQDEYVAQEMAQLVSVAVENARLFDEVQELNRDLERKVVERSRELARQEAVFRAAADQAPQTMWIVNRKGAVTYLNRYWYELVGGAPPKWQGHEWMDAVDPVDVAEMRERWVASVRDHTVLSGFRRVTAVDGKVHTLAYRASPVYDDMGQVICWVGLDADITEIKDIETALRQANDELEAFSYSVSHDLRSPLSTIDGFSRLLEKDLKTGGGKKADHYIARILASAGHMGELIEGLLALAQISRQQLVFSAVDLSAISTDIAERLLRAEPDRAASISVQPGMQAWGDPRLVRALLENLIGNAWKFSSLVSQTQITVGIATPVQGQGQAYFVRDNGEGFDMQYATKLFGAFERLHAQGAFPGTGIGLATVKRIVTRHGGQVWAESQPGAGACFYFTLDAGEAPAPAGPVTDIAARL